MATPKKKTAGSKTKAADEPKDKARAKGGRSTPAKASTAAASRDKKKVEEPEKPAPPPRPPIDPDLLELIRTALQAKKNELGNNVTNELDEMREAAEGHHLADMDDLGGDAHDEETQYKIMEIESAELGEIDAALERIAAGNFGYCEVCEKPIAPDRLRALPFANLCIACKRQQETTEE